MPMLVKMLVVTGTLCVCSWLILAYWQIKLYRRLHKKSLVMFKVMDKLSVKERYKIILARDSTSQDYFRKRNVSVLVLIVALVILGIVMGLSAWFHV